MKMRISWGARLISLFGGVLLIREMVKLIGVDGYAALCILISAFSWLTMLDLGIGFSLQNYLSEHRTDPVVTRNLQHTAGILLVIIGGVAIVVIALFFRQFTLLLFGEAYSSAIPQSALALSVLAGGILSVITGLGTAASKTWFAEHQGHVLIVWTAIATAITLIVAAALNRLHEVLTLPLGVVLFFLPLACVMGYALLIKTRLFSRTSVWCPDHARRIVVRGRDLWLFALASGLTLQVDNLVLTHFVSPENLVTYNVAIRIAHAGLTFYSLALGLLHPLLTEHFVENRSSEISRRVTQIIGLGILFCAAAGIVFLPASRYVIDFIAPGVPDLTSWFKLLMVIYLFIRVWSDAHGVVLMSASKVRWLIASTLLQGIICISIMMIVVPHWGIEGILIAYIGSYLLTNAWYAPFLCYKNLGVRFSFRHFLLRHHSIAQ